MHKKGCSEACLRVRCPPGNPREPCGRPAAPEAGGTGQVAARAAGNLRLKKIEHICCTIYINTYRVFHLPPPPLPGGGVTWMPLNDIW
jgi:hypothetical protein